MIEVNDIKKSPYEIRREYGDFYYQIFNALYEHSNHLKGDMLPHELLLTDNGVTLEELVEILKDSNYSKDDINLIINHLISNEQTVIRKDFFEKDPRYELIDSYFWKSSLQRHFYRFIDDSPNEKKVMAFISDTHIGLDKIYNEKLLSNFYNYIIKKGAKRCFHLGDLFHGINHIQLNEKEKEAYRQLEIFRKEFPNPNELITYLIGGNHDDSIGLFIGGCKLSDIEPKEEYGIEYIKEELNYLRYISALNPSVQCIPQNKFFIDGCELTANNHKFHLNHRLFLNELQNRIKISSVEDIDDKMLFKDYHYDVLVSGHLHKGLIYSSTANDQDKLYLGVPSTTNINLNSVVGYLVYIDENGENMEISCLISDEQGNIKEIERIPWHFKEKNKEYCKQF